MNEKEMGEFVLPYLRKMASATALGLEVSELSYNEESSESLGSTLAEMSSLSRLKIYFTKLTKCLNHILNKVKPLSVLILEGCRLHKEDFKYLSKSHHLKSLKELSLASNRISGSLVEICEIIEGSKNLRILDLDKCFISEKELLKLAVPVSNLKYVQMFKLSLELTDSGENLAHILFSTEFLSVCWLPELEFLQIDVMGLWEPDNDFDSFCDQVRAKRTILGINVPCIVHFQF